MDLNSIKQRLTNMQQASAPKQRKEFVKVDYSKILWKPKAGKHQIRIVPSVLNKDFPFKEVFYHYGLAKFPILSLSNWNEKDPIVEFAKQLRKSKEPEDWKLASKFEPKMRVFVPVIVRGEEHLGTRLWEFGKEIYSQLLSIADDPDYGDYTDVMEGRDFTVEGVATEIAGKKAVKCSIRVKPKSTPISEDPVELEKILNQQPDILSVNKKHTFEELKNILQSFLQPEEEDESVEEDEKPWDDEEVNDQPVVESPKPKSSKNKFEKLFPDQN